MKAEVNVTVEKNKSIKVNIQNTQEPIADIAHKQDLQRIL